MVWANWEEFVESIKAGKLMPEIPYLFVSQEVWEDMCKYGKVSESAEEKIAKQDLLWQKTLEKMAEDFDK